MNLKKTILGTIFIAGSLAASYYCVKKMIDYLKETGAMEQTVEYAAEPEQAYKNEGKFLEKAQQTYEEHEKQWGSANTGDDAELKTHLEDAFTKVDKLYNSEEKGEKALCKEVSLYRSEFGTACRKNIGDVTLHYEDTRHHTDRPGDPETCRLLVKTEESDKGYTGVDFWDQGCDGMVDDVAFVYNTDEYATFTWDRRDEKEFFEKTVDPFWTKTMKKLFE